jgi:hypothetical protein
LTVASDEVGEAEFDQIFDANLLDEFETDNLGADKRKNEDEQKPANLSVINSNDSASGQSIAKPKSALDTTNGSTTTHPLFPRFLFNLLPIQLLSLQNRSLLFYKEEAF